MIRISSTIYSPTEYYMLPVPVMEYNMIRVPSTDCLQTFYLPTEYYMLPVPVMEYNMIRVPSTDCLQTFYLPTEYYMLPVSVNGMLNDPCSVNRLSTDGLLTYRILFAPCSGSGI